MKKLTTLLLLLIGVTFASAQTFVDEAFNENIMPPTDWTIDGSAGNWSADATVNAGGVAPEAALAWSPQFNGTTRLISPVTDLTGVESVVISFKHFHDTYTPGGNTLGVATKSSASADWNVVWSVVTGNDNIGPENVLVNVTNNDVGEADLQFCIFFSGNSYNMDGWYLDDIMLFAPFQLDAELSSIDVSDFVIGETPISGNVSNLGIDAITSFDVNWQIDGGEVMTSSFTGLNIAFGETYEFTHEDLLDLSVGSYNLTVWISSINGGEDGNTENNTISKGLSVPYFAVPHRLLIEDFTSSTCAPCASFNNSFFNAFETANSENFTLLKYQMNWPGNGDPYYTAEGGVRRNFYGVSWVPWFVFNGFTVETEGNIMTALYEASLEEITYVSYSATYAIDGDHVNFEVTILPFGNFTGYVAHSVIFENVTTGNVASNGETEFHHVMMKMVPDANGLTVDLVALQPYTYSASVDMSATNVEEMSDLGVGLLLQDPSSKYVFQSAYASSEVLATDATLSTLTVNGVAVPNFDPNVFTYAISTTTEPVIEATTTDPNAIAVVAEAQGKGVYSVYVFAEDHSVYNVYELSVTVGVDNISDNVTIYPNPANGMFSISGVQAAKVMVYSASGVLVKTLLNVENTLNLTDLEAGAYIAKITTSNGETLIKKLNIIK